MPAYYETDTLHLISQLFPKFEFKTKEFKACEVLKGPDSCQPLLQEY